jgi:superfamily II DNA or RNA helicase
MIACHVSLFEGEAYLWLEEGKRAAFGDADTPAPAEHTFKPRRDVYAHTLDTIAAGMTLTRRDTARLAVWVPALRGVPLPSSPVLGALPEHHADGLVPVEVTARRLSIDELAQVTLRLTMDAESVPGILPGASVHWCATMLKSAIALVSSQRFLPGVRMRNGRWEAYWLPVPQDHDAGAIKTLAAAMPASFRCIARPGVPQPAQPPGGLTESLFEDVVDYIVRSSGSAPIPIEGRKKRGSTRHDSLHDAWLSALRNESPAIEWAGLTDIEEFAAQLEQWRRPVEITAASPFRFCFRLIEPEHPMQSGEPANGQTWKLEYLLSPKDDPSLLIPLADVWKTRGPATRQLRKYGSNYSEYALVALGQAAGLLPPVARSLRSAKPSDVALSTDEACNLLTQSAELLRNAGFHLLLPAWWTGKGGTKRIAVRATMKSIGKDGLGTLSMHALVDFNLYAALGDDAVDVEELRRLASLKSSLVWLRGQWVEVDQKSLTAVLRMLEAGKDVSISARDALALGMGVGRTIGKIHIESAVLSGWLSDTLNALTNPSSFELLPAPPKFQGELRPYQQRGYSWLSMLGRLGLGACLADDMGLGKTIQTLVLIQRSRQHGEKRPVLLVCPTSVVNNWRKEAERFAPDLPVLVHHGSDRHRAGSFEKAAKKSAIVVSSYGLLHRDLETFNAIDWAGVVLDEAQNIKNAETRQSQAARSLKAGYRVALTGTPVENSVADLWSMMEFLNPGWLGPRTTFREQYTIPIQRYGDTGAAERLRTLTGPFILRRLKTDKSIISDLPDKIIQKEYCTLTREQITLYQAVINTVSGELDDGSEMKRRGAMLAALLRLKQVCNHPAHFLADGSALNGRSGKLARLMDILDETRSRGERTLVFSQFAEMGALLQQAIEERFGEEVFFLHGSLTRKKRDSMVERFQKDDAAPHVFILSLKAGGTGLTLTRANHVVHYDRWWNPAVEQQATDRAFRIGQKKNVQVHSFIVAGTLEERIDAILEKKQVIAERVVGSGEQWLTELSNKDFLELISLSNEAVGD